MAQRLIRKPRTCSHCSERLHLNAKEMKTHVDKCRKKRRVKNESNESK